MRTFVRVERALSGGKLNVVHTVADLAIGGGQFRVHTECGIGALVASINPNGHSSESADHFGNAAPYVPCEGCR